MFSSPRCTCWALQGLNRLQGMDQYCEHKRGKRFAATAALMKGKRCIGLLLAALICYGLAMIFLRWYWTFEPLDIANYQQPPGDVIDFANSNNETGFSYFIVPNIVHFIRLGEKPLSFVEVVCLRAAWIQQRPEHLMIHCDQCEVTRNSYYWHLVKDIPGVSLMNVERPNAIYGLTFSYIQHAADVLRLRVLKKYGGIYLDGDSYIVRSLNEYRRYEMSLGWFPGENIGNQVLVAHKNARFLKLCLDSYRFYRSDQWYWNAGVLPTEMFLLRWPHLVHRVPEKFGVHMLAPMLYGQCSKRWRDFEAIHLLYWHRGYLVKSDTFGSLNVTSVSHYNTTFGEMARLALFGTTQLGAYKIRNISWFRQNALDFSQGACS